MTDKEFEAFEAAMVGRKLLVRSIPEPSHKMLLDEHYITYQAARAESAKEIEELKAEVERYIEAYKIAHDQAMSNGQAYQQAKAQIERLQTDREAEMQSLWRIIESGREEKERLQRVADASIALINNAAPIGVGNAMANQRQFYDALREALAAAQNTEKD